MGNLLAPEKPLKDIVRENQRMLKKSIRELEKEIKSLETNQKKLESDIRKHAKMGQMVIPIIFVSIHPANYLLKIIYIGCSKSYGQRLCSNQELHYKIY